MTIPRANVGQERGRGRIFVLTLRSAGGDETTIRRLRWLLKELCRQHRLQCVDIQEIKETMEEAQ